ncbi:sensor histidine kinase [Clostridium brassicae]|uniref:histidine kinase n=1 Tax=Clostridium brassicae TaxID=2999072 RepID=A0ABT4DDJ2_9CLOT|nr:sensor histidine kinase [Clostridium brassicae]MCY6960388.1 sensor histidine kinase [Clostridium brassicae]
MKIIEYIRHKKHLIIFYIILMSFISLIIYLNPSIKVSVSNIIYVNSVSFVFFCIHLFVEYFYFKTYYLGIKDTIEKRQEDIINFLPEAKNYEQNLYNTLLRKLYEEQSLKIENLYDEKRENAEFITSWVHEVKTPIAVSRLIIENSMTKSKDEILDSLEDEIDKIDSYVEQALYYSRIDSFSKDYFINELDLDKLIKEIIKKHAKNFINKKIGIELDNLNFNIISDKKWIVFIIDQIISNALKYTDIQGKIKISGIQDSTEKKLIIEDTGIGIKPEDIDRVFQKGFTGHTGRQDYKSTGMGLYLAKMLSLKLGHDISIQSRYGEYTRVTIHFPKLTNYFNVANQ